MQKQAPAWQERASQRYCHEQYRGGVSSPLDGAAAATVCATPRAIRYALVTIALGGLVLRLFPFFLSGGPLGYPIDYDEGVYFSASALLFEGVLPYRDFVFVHPPGMLYALGLISAWIGQIDAAAAFAAARITAAALGALNVWLVGRAAMRWSGPLAGIVAAALYATYSEVVKVERGPFLEPLLNLLCINLALVWLGPLTPGRCRSTLAGALCGAACAVKFWGGIWLIAAMAALPTKHRKAHVLTFIGAAALTGLVLVAPLALAAPSEFVTQTLLFQIWRPPDGVIARDGRLFEIVSGRHLFASLFGLFGMMVAIVNPLARAQRDARLFVTAYVITLSGFMASSAYFKEYNAHLAVSESILAGFGVSALWRFASARLNPRSAHIALVAGLLMIVIGSASVAIFVSFRVLGQAPPDQLVAGEVLRARVADSQCLFTFDPADGLLGGRLPPTSVSRIAVDPYGGMLLTALQDGARYASATAAFHDVASQSEMRKLLDQCRFVVMGYRGWRQLSDESEAFFRASYGRSYPQSVRGPDLWERSNR